MSNINLYFSPNCKHCINLWNILKEKKLLDSFNKINVLNNRNLPSNLKSVPTIITKNRPPIEGQAIYLFIKSMNSNSSNSTNSKNYNNNTVNSNSNNNESQQSINDYMPGEMSGRWSDQYSFIDNTNPINHSYSFISDNNTLPITQNNISENKNSKQNEMEKRLEQLKQSRQLNFN